MNQKLLWDMRKGSGTVGVWGGRVKKLLGWLSVLILLLTILPFTAISQQPATVPVIQQKDGWRQFRIFVWPYKTNAMDDHALYRQVNLSGFQIDRGLGKEDQVAFSKKSGFPYYNGHVAAKGFLYLTGENRRTLQNRRDLMVRPNSLSDPDIIRIMKNHIERNIKSTREGPVLGYALDDEISLGVMTSPCDVDIHPLSITGFRKWLADRYISIDRLNAQWKRNLSSFEEVSPIGFDQIRLQLKKNPLSEWNLSPWLDFRTYMDVQFSAVLADLVRHCNRLDPKTPAGFVGGQAPSPWGGYDYARLTRAVQWMEAYDLYATNEILRSWWNMPRRPRVLTFFSSKNYKLDSWFFWYYLLHGCQGAVAWPDGWFRQANRDIEPHIKALGDLFAEIQGSISEHIVAADCHFLTDPIGIYYSHPSIQASWAMDAIVHGGTWPNRSSSMDNDGNQSAGVLRQVWCKTCEDLGYQYDFISYLDVIEGTTDLGRFKVIVLPKTVCLSDKEAEVLKKFVAQGGLLVADYLCGLLDEHGKGREKGVLDELFRVRRNDDAGYQDGPNLTEINAERHGDPFLSRFTFRKGSYHRDGICVFERGLSVTDKKNPVNGAGNDISNLAVVSNVVFGKGMAVYLNLSPLEYLHPDKRFGPFGESWRKIAGDLIKSFVGEPRVRVYENENAPCMIESVFWRQGDKIYLGIVKNPSLKKRLSKIEGIHEINGITGDPKEITLFFDEKVELIDIRTNRTLGIGNIFKTLYNPWEAYLYRVKYDSLVKISDSDQAVL